MNRTNYLLPRTILTCFGLGYLRPAPGTWGSLPPVGVAMLMLSFGIGGLPLSAAMLMVAAIATLACSAWGQDAEQAFGKKDPGKVVLDETAGQSLAFLFLPASAGADLTSVALTTGLAFLAFRFFDIAKLWPADALQAKPGGWGIVLDDLVAGLQALVVVQIATRFIWA